MQDNIEINFVSPYIEDRMVALTKHPNHKEVSVLEYQTFTLWQW